MRARYNLSLTPNSNLRTDALIYLTKGRKPLDTLRNDLNVGATTASHTLRELEERELIYQDAEHNYSLTTIGKIVAHKLIDFNDAVETLHTFENFWIEHDFNAIPDDLLNKIGCLKDSRIISGTPINVLKAYTTIIGLLKESRKVQVLSSILIPNIEFVHDMFTGVREMHFILTEDVVHPSIESIGREWLGKIPENYFTLDVIRQNPKIGFFTVTDRFIALVPYRVDGAFDLHSNLISCNKKAIDWGLALFNHYAEMAERIDLS
jgi:predicted transcriptional regulator